MATGVSTSWGGPEVNKIEQVSIDGHQMSLARGGTKFGGPCTVSPMHYG